MWSLGNVQGILERGRPWDVLVSNIWQLVPSTSGILLLKCNKTKRLPLLTAFSSLSDINTTLKICTSIIWSFTLRYVIATTSLWLLQKISYNDVTSISVGNWSMSQCKYNQQKTNVATVSGAHWDGLVYQRLAVYK